ncbi:hypothetical protein [Pseudoalteromonas denitrificans]|uniref:Uncharacterized protein n=1 Tax=Pseudoalteromonas denitrificans DSM 6059 TaxID=1123010 RepID=A0A1I1GRD5_9GAMM|nr:hypothetical protein [Pseudoalteromonas denitrificans]SFC14347.1 hypothetical protein SAMN02745724_01010 [Pseudoalteromonas denitrificans DSM 6059]
MSLLIGAQLGFDAITYSKPKQLVKTPSFDLQSSKLEQAVSVQHYPKNTRDAFEFKNSPDAIYKFEKNLEKESGSTIYDQPNHKSSIAIAAYTSLAHQNRRSEVQDLIGIDVFA